MIASLQTNPWDYSHSFSAYGLTWNFEYWEWSARRTLSTEGLKLDPPSNATFRFKSPQAWLDNWTKKRGNMAMLDKLRPPSTEPEVKQLSLLEIATSNELPVANEQELVANEPSIISLDLEEIRRDGGTQPRAKIDLLHIKRLEEQIEDGQEIEAVVVFHDGEHYWLADGFHRWHAHKNQEQPTITALVHQGSRREAVLYSVGANADHKPALPRSRQDKHRAVLTLLNDPEWGQWSDNQIAKQCNVSQPFVSKLRKDLTYNVISEKSARTYQTKHGTVATMNTTNIGSTKVEQPIGNRVTVRGDSYFEGQSGIITQIPNPRQAIVEFDSGERDLINLRYLVWEGTVWSVAGEIIDNSSHPSDMAQSPPFVPQKVEVNTNDILIAFISNLDIMSEAQVAAAVKAIASVNPDLIRQVMDG